MSPYRTTVLSRIARGLAAASIVTLAVIGATGAANAATTVDPVTDYDAYPAPLPSGCPDGGSALVGLSFANGRGDTASELSGLDVQHGDTVTMSWTGFHEGCLDDDGNPAIMVGLAAYDTVIAGFNQDQDQELTTWANCGFGADPCVKTVDNSMDNYTYTSKPKSTYHLPLTMPASQPCNVQLDAILGRPLAVVGPSGSYYSESLRGDQAGDRLVSPAAHFTLEPCVEETPTTAAPTTTATPTPTVTPTIAAGPSVPGQSLTRNAPAPVVASAQVTPTTRAQVAQQQLPATGANSVDMLRLAAWLCLAGASILLVSSALSRRFLRW